jgi:hypothetical protein
MNTSGDYTTIFSRALNTGDTTADYILVDGATIRMLCAYSTIVAGSEQKHDSDDRDSHDTVTFSNSYVGTLDSDDDDTASNLWVSIFMLLGLTVLFN